MIDQPKSFFVDSGDSKDKVSHKLYEGWFLGLAEDVGGKYLKLVFKQKTIQTKDKFLDFVFSI